MSDLALIVPSRGRPANARRLLDAIAHTAVDVDVVFGLDATDPTIDEYPACEAIVWEQPEHPTMIQKLNGVATQMVGGHRYLGFMGDDHLPRTVGWDRIIVRALEARPHGVVYPNDLFQGENLPTTVFLDARIVEALGWFAPPALHHLYCDNAWADLGGALGTLTYLPDVIVEHLHPHAGKAAGDEQYDRVNSDERHLADRAAWLRWRREHLAGDVATILGSAAA